MAAESRRSGLDMSDPLFSVETRLQEAFLSTSIGPRYNHDQSVKVREPRYLSFHSGRSR
jgi:hypothetical protein